MHVSTEQLLALRDGDPLDATVARHVARCGTCTDVLTALRTQRDALRRLPRLQAPEAWPQIARRLGAARSRRRAPVWPAALATTAVAGVALMWWLWPLSTPREVPAAAPAAAAIHQPGATPAALPLQQEEPDGRARLTTLMARSVQLEGQLAALGARAPAVRRLGHEADAARLRARLWALDAGHAQLPRGRAADDLRQVYWHERVRLLDSMVNIERAERVQRDAALFHAVPATYSEEIGP